MWFLKSHNLYQRYDTSAFKNIYVDVEKDYVSSGYGSINSHTDLQQHYLESLMNDNDSIDTDMNDSLQNLDMSSWIGLLTIHTIPQANK